MSSLHGHLVLLPPNRVWRSYTGGATLDRLAGAPNPADSHLAEDWIGSVTAARNPGRDLPREGIAPVQLAGQTIDFDTLLATDPMYFLGPDHVGKYGAHPQLLVKYLDSATRLHFQCHPSRAFARAHLDSPHGKTEAYHILGVRETVRAPYIYVGFQRPPTREALRTWIETQQIDALEACFDRVPVAPGQTFLIPGGVPHALGEGVFMIEIQEPSDLVARLEFARAGHVLPEAARFMGRSVEVALDLIDFTAYPLVAGRSPFECRASERRPLPGGGWQETLIGPDQTDCFRVRRTELHGSWTRPAESTGVIALVTAGALQVSDAGGTHRLRPFDKVFLPAGLPPVTFQPEGNATLLECLPPL